MEGKCLCQGVELSTTGEPIESFVCYCNHCRLNSGYFCQYISKFDSENFHIADPNKLVKELPLNDTNSGKVKYKYFCSGCGITLYTKPMSLGGKQVFVRASIFPDCSQETKGLKFEHNKTDFVKKCA